MEEREIIEEGDSNDLDKFSNVTRFVLSGKVDAEHQVPNREQMHLTDTHSCSPRASSALWSGTQLERRRPEQRFGNTGLERNIYSFLALFL